MNLRGVRAIYLYEMARTGRTLLQSIVSPVVSTSLYFVVFGAAIGSRITEIEGVAYGAFIVPGLIMLMLLTQSVMNASFGIYFPRFTGTIYEILSAPISYLEIVIGYVGAAATKSIILTTHYIEEAEQMADRIGVINKGEIILVENKAELMRKLGKKELTLQLHKPLAAVPSELGAYRLSLAADGSELTYTYDTQGERTGITALLKDINLAGIRFRDLSTTQSSLEDIFVDLVRQNR